MLSSSPSSGELNTAAAFVSSPETLAPRPTRFGDLHLPGALLQDLFARHLLQMGHATQADLARRIAIHHNIVEELLVSFRKDGRVEAHAPDNQSTAVRYALSENGRRFARDALERSTYTGAAPVGMEQYSSLVRQQTVRANPPDQHRVAEAFEGIVLADELRDRLGATLHSSKAVFIYGIPGSGKSYACRLLAQLLGDPVLVPHAVAAGDTIVQLFDPLLHVPVNNDAHTESAPLMIERGHDRRFILCERPFVTSGGELSADKLEIQYDATTRLYTAPLQMKANNGMYLIDDLGRQRMSTSELFNRWIVPMEEGVDYLNLASGQRVVSPFDLVLVFSTNLDPEKLADGAFLRRIGHKIHFGGLEAKEFSLIWQQELARRGLEYEPELLRFLIEERFRPNAMPMLSCHPRDLIGIAKDYLDYTGAPHRLTRDILVESWNVNFVSVDSGPTQAR